MTCIKAIGFDLGGVIFPDLHVPVGDPVARRLKIAPRQAEAIFDQVWDRLARGQTTEEELWQKLLAITKQKISLVALKAFYRSFLVPDQTVVALIERLALRYPLFVVSNNSRAWLDYELDEYRLRQYFSAGIFNSAVIGAKKPEPEFFEFLVKKLKYPAPDCLFIDDRSKNTAAATKFGFQVRLFTAPAALDFPFAV